MSHHDEINERARAAAASASKERMATAFVASLGSRNLLARAAFGSYVILRHLPPHDYTPSKVFDPHECHVCGIDLDVVIEYGEDELDDELSWMQHESLQFCEATVSAYLQEEPLVPSDSDAALLRELLESIRNLPENAQLSGLLKAVPKGIMSNKDERTALLQILGYCGVLCPNEQRHYTHGYLDWDFVNATQPEHFYKREWAYPVRFWEGRHGVNDDMAEYWFGESL